ncbi:hypothetical protein DPMN_036165 [Dreissena polymorpha]|uniref:Uncharacterized protein n=1 Tax=Dreissena polymorpha TaxID=45954 RepID=A0A9D4MAG5_DREPO|nr:hypothetical protein DPMN_036165 [Dreissena polymorpha]
MFKVSKLSNSFSCNSSNHNEEDCSRQQANDDNNVEPDDKAFVKYCADLTSSSASGDSPTIGLKLATMIITHSESMSTVKLPLPDHYP